MKAFIKKQFEFTVSAFAYALLDRSSLPQKTSIPQRNRVVLFILGQHARMPDYLRIPIVLATLLFDGLGWVFFLAPFHTQPSERRRDYIEFWRTCPLPVFRDLIRFYESFSVLSAMDGGMDFIPQPWRKKKIHRSSCPKETRIKTQVAVVGSGPGGAVTAASLADRGIAVELFEEGNSDMNGECPPFTIQEMAQKYRNNGVTPAFGKPKVAYVEGKCVGGGSEVNSGLYHRIPSVCFDKWKKEFDFQISEKDLEPHYEACEKALSVSLMPGNIPAASLKLQEGATALGWKSMEVPRWFAYQKDSSGKPTSSGVRQTMSRTYIRHFLEKGGKLQYGLRARRVSRKEHGYTTSFVDCMGNQTIVESEKLVLSCGAIGTPALLKRSGVRGKFGESLQMHPTIKIVALFDEEVNGEGMGVPVHQVKEFSPDFSFGCSISSLPYLTLAMLDHPKDLGLVANSWKKMAVYYAMITPKGLGAVRIVPGFRDPFVSFPLVSDDLKSLSTALSRLGQLLFTAGARRLFPSIVKFGSLDSVDDLARIPQSIPSGASNLMTIHLFSTCPSGENRKSSAVNSEGKVHGEDGLYIADASIIPTAPGVNPQGAIMALAHRNAGILADEISKGS